jgi:hypothetical protein
MDRYAVFMMSTTWLGVVITGQGTHTHLAPCWLTKPACRRDLAAKLAADAPRTSEKRRTAMETRIVDKMLLDLLILK